MRRFARAHRAAQEILKESSADSFPIRVEAIAKKHAHILRDDMDDDISGILIPLVKGPRGRKWAIVVNKGHHPVRQRFTIAHELGHLLLHGFTSVHADRGYRLRFRNQRSAEGNVFEEIEANQFAAELLMPEGLLLEELATRHIEYVSADSPREDPALTRLAKKLDVSTQALAIRLSTLLL